MVQRNVVSLPDIVGGGYGTFWKFRGRYRAVKGSRRSKKSKTMALWVITNMMKYPQSNTLVVRKVFSTLHDSCFTELKWAIHRLQVDAWWDIKESPIEMTYTPTGQKIYFRGLDDPLKITSIATEVGVLSWMWIEEAYEITKEDDFETLLESMLGDCPEGLFKQVTLTFNPWNEKTWLKKRFFDVQDPDVLAITTNYLCNEWLSDADKAYFDDLRVRKPARYNVAGLGNWGVSEGCIFEDWKEEKFDIDKVRQDPEVKSAFGMDFGYTNDPSTLFCGMISQKQKIIWVFDEMYKKGMSNERIFEEVSSMGYAKEKITADCAEPKSIARLRELGITHIRSAKKGKDSVNNGIDFLKDYTIIVHPRCVNFITEISNYTWDRDKFGNWLNKPIDDFNHLMDAMRYAVEGFATGDTFSFN